MAQRVKRLPAMWETWVQSLSREDPLEKKMATHSSTLAWKIPWTGEPGGLQSTGSHRVGCNEWLSRAQHGSGAKWKRKLQERKARDKPARTLAPDLCQRKQGYTGKKRQPLQSVVLEKLGSYL